MSSVLFDLIEQFDESDQAAIDRHSEERKAKAILDEQVSNSRIISSENLFRFFCQDLKQASSIETQESIEETPLEVSDDEDEETKPVEQQTETVVEEPISNPPPVPSSSSSSSDNEGEDESSAYPDTQVTYSEELPVKIDQNNPKKQPKVLPKPVNKSNNENQPLKRGQRARLKKIKEKYKDQDEEDRQVRMQLLGSAGNESKKKQLLQQQQQKAQSRENKKKKPQPPVVRPQSAATAIVDDDEGEQQEDEEEKAKRLSEDAHLLSTLTGQPTSEDPLINVIGVCAPWVALINYKYKVKILPGTVGKKGKSMRLNYLYLF